MKNLCCKCPCFYSSQDYFSGEYDWGCRVFGDECSKCPSFWDDEGEADFERQGCNVHPKRLEFLLMRENRRLESWIKSDFKLDRSVKHYSEPIKTKEGYKAIRKKDGLWMGFYTDNFYPNLKGGHRHNHIRNAHKRMRKCHVCGGPIVKGCEYTDGFSEFQCRSCRTEECREQAYLLGLSFGGCEFKTRRR